MEASFESSAFFFVFLFNWGAVAAAAAAGTGTAEGDVPFAIAAGRGGAAVCDVAELTADMTPSRPGEEWMLRRGIGSGHAEFCPSVLFFRRGRGFQIQYVSDAG